MTYAFDKLQKLFEQYCIDSVVFQLNINTDYSTIPTLWVLFHPLLQKFDMAKFLFQ